MFSSDYPHAEGGRNPYGRFKSATKGLPESTLECFYRRNFEDLMGSVLARWVTLRSPATTPSTATDPFRQSVT